MPPWIPYLSKNARRLDTRFTPLTLLLDQGGQQAQAQRFQPAGGKTHAFTDPRDILTNQPDTLAFVLLGSPGSGKSTLLQRLEWDIAKAAIGSGVAETLIPFYINLNRYKADDNVALSPWAWLSAQWPLGDLKALMKTGRVLLLVDALNEMPHTDEAHYQHLLTQWQDFLREVNDYSPGNRVIFSCRALNYSIGLSTPKELPVPHIRIESLNETQIADFLQCYHSKHADTLFQQLKEQKQLEFYSNPYFLSLLVDQVTEGGGIPKGRAALFTGFVRQVLIREMNKDSPLAKDFLLLTPFDRTELQNNQNETHTYQLPDEGTLCSQLQTLAIKMQDKVSGQENIQMVISRQQALDDLAVNDGHLLQAGVAIGILDEYELTVKRSVKYSHQLFHEYFSARQLAKQPQPQTVASAWLQGEPKPTLEETLASIADYESLPPSPSSPWYETT